MTIDLTLRQTHASGRLLPATLSTSLTRLANAAAAPSPRGTIQGQELRLGMALSPMDGAAATFFLDFGGQGARVRGAAHGPSAALLRWAFHALATLLACTLHDDAGQTIVPDPEAHRGAAVAYLASYEADVRASRERGDDESSFVAWLAREQHVALAEDADVAVLGARLPMDDASRLYEMLLESDEVDDVFVSERELASLLARYRARTT